MRSYTIWTIFEILGIVMINTVIVSATIIDFDQGNQNMNYNQPPRQQRQSPRQNLPPAPAPRTPRPNYDVTVRFPLSTLLRVFNPPNVPQLMPIQEQVRCLKNYLEREKNQMAAQDRLQRSVARTQADAEAAMAAAARVGREAGRMLSPSSPYMGSSYQNPQQSPSPNYDNPPNNYNSGGYGGSHSNRNNYAGSYNSYPGSSSGSTGIDMNTNQLY